LKIMFEFKSAYEPGLGEVVFEGELIDVEEDKIAEDALKQWKKDKTISQVLARPIIDSILARSTIESVIVSREIGLPPPIPVPRVSEKTNQQYIG
ncbi:MAG: hypothetical protein NTV63_01340, partial [Candidatus Woesearchaeota archaeon]|nr:hypothetical protein [Candidatus Woesearchaeota archaeon]